MQCPHCSANNDKVIESRSNSTGTSIRRRRECLDCGYRFTSYEHIEEKQLMVVKRDGRREPFDRQKLERGLQTSLEKRCWNSFTKWIRWVISALHLCTRCSRMLRPLSVSWMPCLHKTEGNNESGTKKRKLGGPCRRRGTRVQQSQWGRRSREPKSGACGAPHHQTGRICRGLPPQPHCCCHR